MNKTNHKLQRKNKIYRMTITSLRTAGGAYPQ